MLFAPFAGEAWPVETYFRQILDGQAECAADFGVLGGL